MNHQEKRRETIHDVIGQMTDAYLEEAANDSSAIRGETIGARRRKAVLKWVIVAAAALLLVGGMVFAAVMRESAKRPSGPSSTTEDRVEAPAVLQYASNGDGTCRVIGITNPTKADFVTVTVPAEYNGEQVVAYEPANIALPYPDALSAEAFRLLLDKMAAAINADSAKNGKKELNWRDYESAAVRHKMPDDSGNDLWLDFTLFRAYYTLISLDNCETDAEKTALREKYPEVVNTDLYAVAEEMTSEEHQRLADLLLKILPEYSAKDKFADEMSVGRVRGDTVVSTQITEVIYPASRFLKIAY